MKTFAVVYDGPSRPMIKTPKGRLLSLSQFQNGQWGSYEREDDDCKIIVDALNLLIENAPEIIEHWRDTEGKENDKRATI